MKKSRYSSVQIWLAQKMTDGLPAPAIAEIRSLPAQKSALVLGSWYGSPAGPLYIMADPYGVCGIHFWNSVHFQNLCKKGLPVSRTLSAAERMSLYPADESMESGHVLALRRLHQAAAWLDSYFGRRQAADALQEERLPLHLCGTPFQLLIWQLLLEIPYGQSVSYSALAQRTAFITGKDRMAVQAAGQAASRNPVCIVIPCHRVIQKDGMAGGYAAGTETKKKLLQYEEKRLHRNGIA